MSTGEIDRIAPTLRPSTPVRGYQRWRTLLFAHWEVDAEVLQAMLPPQLTLDTFRGAAYVGLVPFWMEGVRAKFVPDGLGMAFLETNVRTYVHVDGRDPGVYFFSLDAESALAVLGARVGWSLPYYYADMTRRIGDGVIDYSVKRIGKDEPRLDVRWEIGELLGPSKPDTLEHFLAERYFLHCERRGRIYSGRVHHVPYPLAKARTLQFSDQLLGADGIDVSGPPQLVHYAAGVDVEIFDLKPRDAD